MAVKPERQTGLDLTPGTSLGKCEIIRKLAVGGMAEIYLSRVRGNAGFEKLVVLKRILPHIAQDPAFVQMFLEEARLAATLQHPNIADVYDVGEANGEVFFTMEYVHGQDVRGIRWVSRKRDEPIPLAIALAIVQGTAAALDYAHEKRGSDGQLVGLVHRDVSSSNVMISYDGAIKLLDFGIAKLTTKQNKTQTGTLKGKIPYMSPEQCRGHKLDRRSDLFSLGSLMFEVTVGRRPFRGQSDFEMMEQIVHHGAPRPSTLINGYPPDLEVIVMKLLARDPDERYQSAEELMQELEPFLAQHRLWASSKPIGKYMRLVFADRISAWEQAQQQGVSFVQHIAGAHDPEISEVHTPPLAFQGLRSLSKEMPAVMRPSSELPAPRASSELSASGATVALKPVPTFTPPAYAPTATMNAVVPVEIAVVPVETAVPAVVAAPIGFDPSAPTPQLRSGRRMGFIIGGVVVGVIGIVAVVLLGGGGKKDAGAVDSEPQSTHETKRNEAKPVETKPEIKPETRPTVADTKPVESKPVQSKPVETKPVEAKPVESKPVEAKPIAAKPVEAKPVAAKPVVKSVAVIKKPQQPVRVVKPVKPGKKDPGWDPNSPFLPPEQ